MKKILLTAINSSWSQSNPAIYYLREMIADLPYAVILHEWTLKDRLWNVLSEIYCQKAEVICFSAYIWNRLYLQELIPEVIKLLPEAVIVIGGPEAESLSCLKRKGLYIVQGAGEGKFRFLAEHDFSANDEDLSRAKHIPLKDIPFPYRESDGDTLKGKLLYYETFRGCPFACIYCLSANDKRSELRYQPNNQKDMQCLIKELETLISFQPRTIKFVDRSFNLHKQLAHYIWKFFMKQNCPCDVHFEIYPDLLEEDDIALLAKAPENRIRLEIGIQTINSEVALNCGRKSNWEKTKWTLQELKKRTNIRIHTDLLAGLPGENYASVLNGLNEVCATLPDAVQLGILKILPDTPMQKIASELNYKWLSQPPYQCLSSDALSFEEIQQLENFAKLLNLYWNKEEHKSMWQEMLQTQSATDILTALQQKHQELGYELHSLSKAKRNAVIADICVAGGRRPSAKK
jgi:anaerobic magnesium-protoporphyrin IX monomethyl ester cyclase